MGETFAFWDQALKDIADRGRAGAVDPVAAVSEGMRTIDANVFCLFSHMENAQRSGLPLTVTIQAMRRELREARMVDEKRSSIFRLMTLKTIVVVGMALAFRLMMCRIGWGLTGVDHFIRFWGPEDVQSILLGLMWLAMGSSVWVWHAPRSWLWKGKVTNLGQRWFATHLSGEECLNDPWGDEVKRIKQMAWSQGISCMADLRGSLEVWSLDQNHQVKERLRQMEELFPVWEMVVLGFSMVLFLVVPSLSTLAVIGDASVW
jgi:hypothetical protein